MNNSMIHKTGEEKITRPAASSSAQRVMSRTIAAYAEKPVRHFTFSLLSPESSKAAVTDMSEHFGCPKSPGHILCSPH